MTRVTTPGNSWRRYIASLADLRLTIEQNALDYEFAASGGRIVYLFDANVVGLFLNPVRESRHIPRVGLRGPGDHLRATSMMTAEFLFSRKLSGQDGLPPYLTQAHAEDVAAVVDRLEATVVEKRREFAVARADVDEPTTLAEVNSIIEAARKNDIDGREAARRLNYLVPDLAEFIFDGPLYEARQFRRIVAENLLRPLRLLPQATAGVLKPDERLVRGWITLLTEELNRAATKATNRTGASEQRLLRPRSIRRDAETLAQLQLLNDAAEASARRVRHVLVTTDRVMMRAYTRWFYSGGDQRRDGYALRHPAQYVPILNAGQMVGNAQPPGLFDQVRDAIDGLFQALTYERPGYMRILARVADTRLTEADERRSLDREIEVLWRARGSVDDNAVRQVREIWTEAARAAVLLGAPLLQRHLAPAWDAVFAIIDGEDGIRRGVLDHLDNLLFDVEMSHTGFLVGGFLAVHTGNSAVSTSDSNRRRLLIRPWSPELRKVLDAPSLDTIASSAIERGTGAALPIAACVAFRVGRWESARHFCSRASEVVVAMISQARPHERSALLRQKHELRYLEGEIERYRPTTEHARHATKLKSSLEYYARVEDLFGLARTHCARAALSMAVILSRESSRDARSSLDMPHGFIDFLAAVDDAQNGVRLALLVDPSVEPLAPYLVDEALLVYLTVAIYDIRVARTGSLGPDAAQAACEMVRDRAHKIRWPQPPMLRLASDCALWTIGDGAQRMSAAEHLRRALEADPRPVNPSDRWLFDRVASRAALDAR